MSTNLTRRRPAALQPLYRERDGPLGLLACILADRREVHVGKPSQHAVVIFHDRKITGNLHAQPDQRVKEPDGAAVIGSNCRGGLAAGAERRCSGTHAFLLGVVAGDDPHVAGEAEPAHACSMTASSGSRLMRIPLASAGGTR